MANAATFPIQMNGTDLRFGDVTVPLNHCRSFWANKENREITVYCHPVKDYQTTFRLFLENGENMHECIRTFMQKTEMHPSLFYVRDVKPIIADEVEEKSKIDLPTADTKASIRFEFMYETDREYFLTYALPNLPGFTSESSVRGDNLYCATLTYSEAESKPSQIQRINAVFAQIMEKFGRSGIKEAVSRLDDQRFPMERDSFGGMVADRAWCFDHYRDYRVTKAAMDERIAMPGERDVLLPAKKEDIEAWSADPTAFAGKQSEKYQYYLKAQIQFLLQEKPVDNAKLKPLMDAALSIPGFDIAEVFQSLSVKQAVDEKRNQANE